MYKRRLIKPLVKYTYSSYNKCPKNLKCKTCGCTFLERVKYATGGYEPSTVDMEFLMYCANKCFNEVKK